MRSLARGALATAAVAAIQSAFSSGAWAATRTWSGGGTDANWATGLNWVGGAAPTPGADSLVFDGFAQLSNTNNFAAGSQFNGITLTSTAGAFTLGGNQITLGGDITDNTALLVQTINLPLLLNATRNVSVTDSGLLTLGGVISGGFGLNKNGNGALTLSGTNTFSGPVTINAGTVSISSDANLGAAPGAPTAGQLVINGTNGVLRATSSLTLNANRGIAIGPSAGAGSGTIETLTGVNVNYGGVIANNGGGTGSLNKIRFGSLTLSGANTYSGATNVRNGSLILDFAATSAPTNNIINSASNLVLGGATAGLGQNNNASLIMTGKASTANVQSFAGTHLDIYGSVITATNGATGGTARINLGNLTHSTGGTLVVTSGSGQVHTTATNTRGILGGWAIAGTPNVQRGITMGTDFATVDGSGFIVPYTGYVTAPPVGTSNWVDDAGIAANADKNLRFIGSATPTELRVAAEGANTTFDINTLNYQTAGANHVLTIGTGNTLRLGTFGGLFKSTTGNNQLFIGGTGGSTFTPGPNANAGNITAGGPNPNTPGELVISLNDTANNNGGMTLVSNIVDNGTGAVTLIKNSVMSVKIDGHNSYSGGTYINQGRFQLAGSEQLRDSVDPTLTVGNPDGLGTGPVFIAPGAYLFISGVNGTAVYTGPGAIAGALAGTAQNAPILNNMTISGNGTNQEGIGAIRLGNRSILSGNLTLGGDARIGGGNAAAYPAINPDLTTLYVDPGNLLSGQISGDFAFDIGAGVSVNTNLVLSNPANNWSGTTTILGRSGGSSRLRLGASEVLPHGAGKGNLVFNANGPATLDMNGFNETVNGLSSAGSTTPANAIVENNGFTATINDPTPGDKTDDNQTYVFTAGTSTLTVGGFDQSATFGGIIRDSDAAGSVTLPNPNFEGVGDPEGDLPTVIVTAPWATGGAKVALTKIGTGLQVLGGINTYTGPTTVNGGVLAVTGALDSAGTVTVNSGAVIAGAGDGTTGRIGNVTVNSGGAVSPGSSGVGTVGTLHLSSLGVTSGNLRIDFSGATTDVINVLGAATFAGASTISPSGTPTAGTYTVLQATSPITGAGTLTLAAFPSVPDTRPAGGSLDLTDPNAVKVVITGGAKTLTWTGGVNSTWDLGSGGTNNWTDGAINEKFFNADFVTFADGPTNRNINIVANVQPTSVTVSSNVGSDYTFGGTGAIAGTAALTKSGTGTLTVNNANTYTGGTQINGGVVVIGTGGSLGTGAIAVDNFGILRINRTDTSTFSNAVSGGGNIEHTGTGTTTFTANKTYTGTTTISAGTVVVQDEGSLGGAGGGAVTIASGATLDLTAGTAANGIDFGAKQFNVGGTGVGGNGAIVNSGLTQNAAFELVSLTANTLINTIGAGPGNGRFDVRRDAIFADNNPDLALNSFTLTKTGGGQFSLVNVDVGAGNIVVNQGILAMESFTQTPDTGGTITYNDGTTAQWFNNAEIADTSRPIIFNGNVSTGNADNDPAHIDANMTINGTLNHVVLNAQNTTQTTFAGNLTGPGALTKAGNTTLVLAGTGNTYAGGTTVSGGTLTVNSGSGLGTGALAVNNPNTGAGTNVQVCKRIVKQFGQMQKLMKQLAEGHMPSPESIARSASRSGGPRFTR